MNPVAQLQMGGLMPPSSLDYLDPRTMAIIMDAMAKNPGLQLKSFFGQRLYDTARVQSGTALTAIEFPLFATPIGNQQTEVNGVTQYTKTRLDTNMSVSRQLPAGEQAWITSIQVRVVFAGSLDNTVQTGNNLGLALDPGIGTTLAAADDVVAVTSAQAITESFVIQFLYNQTVFEQGPLYLFPSRYGISGVSGGFAFVPTTAGTGIMQNETLLNNGFGFVFTLPIVRHIDSLYQFGVSLLPINLFVPTRNFRIQVILEGLGAKAIVG